MARAWTRRQVGRLAGGIGLAAAAVTFAAGRPFSAGKARVVVIGGGAGGAAASRHIAAHGDALRVTLVEANRAYTSCFFSNHHIGGLRTFDTITHGYSRLSAMAAIDVVHDRAVDVDPIRKTVRLAGGGSLAYDRLIVAPGIDFDFDAIEGYGAEAARLMPHAWQGGRQIRLLRERLVAMADGGTFVIAPPAGPQRCPPAPYERVSLVAAYFKRHKPRSKILIVDAKDKFSMQKLFEDGWLRFYPDMIEWLPAEFGGGAKRVDTKAMTVSTEDETLRADAANVIPPQRAGRIAARAGLADQTGWCPVEPATLASRLQSDIHVVGDAIIPGDMPKSAFAAHSQARRCAQAVLAALAGAPAPQSPLPNTCWSLIAPDHGVRVGGVYEPGESGFVRRESSVSSADESDAVRAATARAAEAWYDTIVADMFG